MWSEGSGGCGANSAPAGVRGHVLNSQRMASGVRVSSTRLGPSQAVGPAALRAPRSLVRDGGITTSGGTKYQQPEVQFIAFLTDNRHKSIAEAKATIYQIKITLLGMEPPIWRRLQVPGTIPLCCFHDALQAVMGWTDSHLHQFEKDGLYWGRLDNRGFHDDIDVLDESRVPVANVLLAENESLVYVYDFGDNWRHDVRLEKILPCEAPTPPVCLGGERRCPPEDVGGPSGYQHFLDVIFDPGNEEFEHYVRWLGGPFHAEEFDYARVNETLRRIRWQMRHRQ
jgi:hypothetical protein